MMKKLVFVRRISQIFFLLIFISILWTTDYHLKGLLPAETFFKLDPLIVFFTSISGRVILNGLVFSILMVLLTFILGRFFCGWVCPLGTMIDMAGTIIRKRRPIQTHLSRKTYRLKFMILLGVTLFAILGIQVAWVLDPTVIMARFVSLNFIPTITSIIHQFFILMIKTFNLRGALVDIYHYLTFSFLDIKVYYFFHSLIIFSVMVLICGMAWWVKRYWCRVFCPLGALYAGCARFAWLERAVTKDCTHCKRCRSYCRMGAINEDLNYIKGECILCMDCIYDCVLQATQFKFILPASTRKTSYTVKEKSEGINRRQFLFLMVISFFSLGTSWGQGEKRQKLEARVIRPPAALEEEEFLNRCIRCGNCMKVCITNGLQPALLQAGFEGIWTPQLIPEIGYCEYLCTLCGNVCPTAAIPHLTIEQKKKTRLGLAEIDEKICLPWSEGKDCIVCEEYCPVFDKAIKLKKEVRATSVLLKPYVDEELCMGCGICQTKCPTRPIRAIRVSPRNADRT